jgi:DMSO/TMAO reductase YedYZ molybdopterin-dependent catalytic subunit
MRKQRHIRELVKDGAEAFAGRAGRSRRQAFGDFWAGMLGATLPFGGFLSTDLIPVALAESAAPLIIPGKPNLEVVGDRPLNAEPPAHLLDNEVTPSALMFVRNHGITPEFAYKQDAKDWRLTIDGEVEKTLQLSLDDLKKNFPVIEANLLIECAGNGRAGFYPATAGNQWTYGAVGCPRWTGVRIRDILNAAGLKKSAVYTGFYGHDKHLNGDPTKVVISRGTPIAKALDENSLIAWGMNGEPLPAENGFPARLVIPGWPASTCGKWLKRFTIRDKEHDGEKMLGKSYRMPRYPIAPGGDAPDADMKIIEAMPVKSLLTFPMSGEKSPDLTTEVRGFAWSGDSSITKVEVSIDFGASWQPAAVAKPANTLAWQRFSTKIKFPSKGYFEIWSRATDARGVSQPLVVPGWNPQGYLNNACPRISRWVG